MSTKTRTSEARTARMTGDGRTAARFAYAAGILANALLLAFFAFQFGRPEGGISFGTANDLVGSLATALMIPAAFALSSRLPRRRSIRIVWAVGAAAMAVLTVGGPLLVAGTLAFEVQGPIMTAAWMALCVWLFSVNRWARLSGALPMRTARFGEVAGAGPPVGGVLAGVGFLLPWMLWGQWVFFGAGGVFGAVGFLGIPVWFLLVGRNFAGS